MGFFEFGRDERFPTQYDAKRTAVTVDLVDAGLATACIILGISFFISLLTRKLKTNVVIFTRVYTTILIGTLLLINNFGQEWEVGHINSVMAYKAGSVQEINGSVSLKIALRGINVTLKATPDPNGPLKDETIDYNERFEWVWDQGRFGFGPYAGLLQREFREAQYRGAPLPIIWVVDYFVIDGEGQRYGRFYRTAGWYTHILMWTTFPCWLLSTILFRSVIRYGAYFLGICGGLQLLANLVYLVVRNPFPLSIPFEEETLTTHFGFNYWCTFVLGLICVILAGVIVYMDMYHDELIYSFFGVNPLNSYDEVVYLTKEERQHLRRHQTIKQNKSMTKHGDIPLVEMEAAPPVDAEDDDEDVEYIPVYLKRKTVVLAPSVNRGNKPNRHRMPLPPPSTSHAS
ncbi:unnamed protein product [Diabrotica balteata]|uniref:Dual oxidase maturation factor 1 n=1 Tax=Diabrotica balteata TaxID=107213 RepID=A0A9N9SWZ8_DIABA|nr:unnamed protein product [Diabrotica balteata]